MIIRSFLFGLVGLVLSTGIAAAHEYTIRITNLMSEELLAPILITSVRKDKHIFDGSYVTPEAEAQILTGDPGMLAGRIGKKAMVVHGSDGPPGVLLAPGKSVEITVPARSRGQGIRFIAMVAPTMKPDHFVSAVINPANGLAATMDRYDIGHDEGSKSVSHVSSGAARIEIIGVMDK